MLFVKLADFVLGPFVIQPLVLSFAQQRLWFLAQMEGVSRPYHIPFSTRLRGSLDGSALRRALDRILARHEALRTTFLLIDGEPVQQIASVETSRFVLLEHDLEQGSKEDLRRLVVQEAGEPFDLRTGPLIRGRLIRLTEEDHVLLITMHHIVSDGWSMGVFRSELSTLYAAFRSGQGFGSATDRISAAVDHSAGGAGGARSRKACVARRLYLRQPEWTDGCSACCMTLTEKRNVLYARLAFIRSFIANIPSSPHAREIARPIR